MCGAVELLREGGRIVYILWAGLTQVDTVAKFPALSGKFASGPVLNTARQSTHRKTTFWRVHSEVDRGNGRVESARFQDDVVGRQFAVSVPVDLCRLRCLTFTANFTQFAKTDELADAPMQLTRSLALL